ncbi:MAG: nitroreductase family protein [Candidatus Omnitrophica bacterium]|nr:nitroreductase family protein [Candidatus Omnitrophota bacterium]
MNTSGPSPRIPQEDIDPQFTDRWSPRSFRPASIRQEELLSILEAARWAPSCYNDQPWIFCYAIQEEHRRAFLSALAEKNQRWAAHAPALLFLAYRKNFAHNGKSNRWAAFDCGAAWMSLALQARKRGLHAHAMAGFDADKAHTLLNLPKDRYEIIAAVAVGKRGSPEQLDDEFRDMEKPNQRQALDACAHEGAFSAAAARAGMTPPAPGRDI